MYKLALFGNPIEHSLSPLVFSLFAKQFALTISYEKILAKDDDDFKFKVLGFFANGATAINITSPFKNAAYHVANEHTARAKFCKSSNFIRKNDNKLLIADTTDGIGLIEDIKNNKRYNLSDKKILIIGSGFVLDSILLDLIIQNPREISVLARNEARISYLSNQFGVSRFDANKSYDVVFNSIPNSMGNNLFSMVQKISDDALCYDLTYTKNSIFLDTMKQLNPNCRLYNGLGMLVEQAKVAFYSLFNKEPDSKIVLEELIKLGYSNN